MFNNTSKEHKEQDKMKNNRLSLPTSSSTRSFDSKSESFNKYYHLEYHQKMQNILSNSQFSSKQPFTSALVNAVPILPFNQNIPKPVDKFTYSNFNMTAPLNTNATNIFFPLQANNIQQKTSLSYNANTNHNVAQNQNDNLIFFDTQDDLNVLDVFDPLRSKQNKHATKSLESINKVVQNEIKPEIKKITEKEIANLNEIKIRSISNNEKTLKPTTQSLRKTESTEPSRSNEIEKFSKHILKLKHETDCDENISKLINLSPCVGYLLSSAKNLSINLNIRYYSDNTLSNKRYQPLSIQVSLNSNVETLAYYILNLYQIEDMDISKYLFKIHGMEEYLPYSARLIELKYFYECINENKEPVLILTELKNANTELTNKNLNKQSSSQQFDAKIKDINMHDFSASKLESTFKILIEKCNLIVASINNDDNTHLDRILNLIRNVKEKLISLKSALFDIGHDLTEELLFKIDFYEQKLIQLSNAKFLNEKEPLMTNNLEYSYQIELSSTSSRIDQVLKSLKEIIEKSIQILVSFVKYASLSFYSSLNIDSFVQQLNLKDFNLNSKPKETIEIIQADQKLTIYFKGLSRLDNLFKRLNTNISNPVDLYLKFSVVYGVKVLDKVNVRLDKFERYNQRKNDFFIKSLKIQFDRIDLCVLPREATLLIQLFASNLNSNQNISNGFNNFLSTDNNSIERAFLIPSTIPITGSVFENENDKCLAWTTKTFFNDELFLESDEYFMCMFDNIPDISSATCTASNIYSKKSPVVQIMFPKYEHLYKYPNVTYECECNLKDFQKLPSDLRDTLINICNKSIVADKLSQNERDLINEYFAYLNGIPYSLSKVYLSLISYDYSSIIHFYAYLKHCDTLSLAESIELLMPQFPDQELRKHALKSLEQNTHETISLYLPQLLEAIKYEKTHYSELVLMLIRLSSKSLRFAHKLYWHLREFLSRDSDFVMIRYQMLYEALKLFFNNQMIQEIEQEVFLVKRIDQIAAKVKELKDNEKLLDELDVLQKEWTRNKNQASSSRLPYNISYCVKEIDIKSCSFISSFTVPLKLVFKNNDSTANSFYSIYKIGDDLRQDMFVLQMIDVMNQLWLAEDLDLNLITFQCLQTGNRRGYIEMITNAETLKEIQKGAVMNAFKKSCINDWLRSHNPKIVNFKKAVENFTRSCAAYSVATYLLGIGDRHNDNIMVKYTGHMFHIDFGKYLGDAQTFAGFKRDRTPILFTSDMFFVINQAKDPNHRFQEFIELCCKSFQILRKNYNHLLSLIELMIDSGIPGLNRTAIQYVYKNLMIDLDEDESSNALKKLIHESLSKFASINFAIHTLAQPKTVNSSNYFSFVTHIFNSETDGKIVKISLEKTETTNFSNTKELIKCLVTRETEFESNEVYRTFDEFCELYNMLSKTFLSLRLIETPSYNKFKEAKPFLKRCLLVETFLREITSLHPEISQSDLIYTFFHPILRDKKQETFLSNNNSDVLSLNGGDESSECGDSEDPGIKGEVKLKLKFKDNKFYVNCLQCRNLKPPFNQSVSSLKPYVKCYLRPDYTKATKKKVQALFNGANPIFTETIEYDINFVDLKTRTLELSVLNNRINFKEKIGSIEIRLCDINWESDYVKWYYLR